MQINPTEANIILQALNDRECALVNAYHLALDRGGSAELQKIQADLADIRALADKAARAVRAAATN